jgi:hypothetical protein
MSLGTALPKVKYPKVAAAVYAKKQTLMADTTQTEKRFTVRT